jgi:acyl-CoA reductase-like NAD-dependent aldehyde dehydrogenase
MSSTLISNTVKVASVGRAMNWINGKWVDSQKRTNSFDPSTSQEIGTYADASHADVESAIQAAARAFANTDWKDNRHLRSKVLNQLADRFREPSMGGMDSNARESTASSIISGDRDRNIYPPRLPTHICTTRSSVRLNDRA